MLWPIIWMMIVFRCEYNFIAKTTGVMYSCVYIMVRGL